MSGEEFVSVERTPRSGLAGLHWRWCVEQRLHDAPGLLHGVLEGELAGVSAHRVT
jgi:hypothetical protein